MSIWQIGEIAMLALLAGGFWIAMRGEETMRLVGLQFSGTVACMALVIAAIGQGSPSFIDVALTLVLLALGATLMYAHFMERWL